MAEPSKLDILIDIKARLDEIAKANAALRQTKQEASGASNAAGGFFAQFRQGLGLGAGMFTVASAVSTVKAVITETIGEAIRMANEVKDTAANLQMSTDGLQALRALAKTTGGDINSLTGALNTQQRTLIEAANNATGPAAAAYERLGLSVAKLQGMPLERQFEAIARAIAGASDKQDAFRAAAVALGERNLPRLRAALQELGTQGYDKVKEQADAAIMSPTAIATLSAATEAWKRAKDIFVTKVGEDFAALLNLIGVKGTVPQPVEKTGDELRSAQRLADQQEELEFLRGRLEKAQLAASNVASDTVLTEVERVEALDRLYDQQIEKLGRIIALRKLMPLAQGETQQQRDAELRKLEAELTASQNGARGNLGLAGSDYQTRVNQRATRQANMAPHEVALDNARNVNDPEKNPDYLTAGQGMMEGFANWSAQVGSVGEQIAGTLTGTIGGAISTLSAGITGLITGTQEWGEVGQQMGLMFLQSLIQIGLQMAAQKVIEAGLLAFHIGAETTKTTATVTGAGIRAAAQTTETAATKTSALAKLADAAIGAMKSMSSIPYVGPILAIAAMGAILAAGYKLISGGFESGGYTSPGPKDRPAGVVHAGEWVAPKWMVESPKYGGLIAALEGERSGAPGYEFGGGSTPAPSDGNRKKTFIEKFTGGSLGQWLGNGGLPAFLLPKWQNNLQKKWNFLDGTKYWGDQGPGVRQEYVNGEWRTIGAGAASDNYGVSAGSAGASGVYGGDAGSAASIAAAEAKPTRYLVFSDDRAVIANAARNPDFENLVVDISRRNRGVILEGGA